MEEKGMAYYLEDLNRVHDLSMEKLGEWKEQYPYSQMAHFLMAKKHQLEGFVDDMSVFHKASFYAVDRVFLKERMEEAVVSPQSSVRRQEAELSLQSSVVSPDAEVEDQKKDRAQEAVGSEQLAVDNEEAVSSKQSSVIIPDSEMEVKEGVESQEAVGSEQLAVDNEEEVVSPQSSVVSQKIESELKEDDLSPFAKWVNDFSVQNIDIKKKKKKKNKKSKLEKKIKESIIANDEIISEPLANILAQQGHIEKAKAMYEKLSLIFPEKSSFFALQIEKLINSK